MKTITKIILLLSISANSMFAQNLVLNPSFENTSGSTMGCPRDENLVSWINPDTSSTPDLFSSSCTGNFSITGVPSNGLGFQQARTGTNYAGFIPYSTSLSNYREYMEGQLSNPLVAGQNYCVSFYVSLIDNAHFATNRIGMYLSDTTIFYPGSTVTTILPYTPQLQAPAAEITDTINWVKLQWQYTATGGEQFFTIGNFFDDANTTDTSWGGNSPTPFVYYYVEDVSIESGICLDSATSVGTQHNNNDASLFQVYPNPSTGIINLLNANGKPISVTIYNTLGELILKTESTEMNIKLDLELYPTGVYFVKIVTGNGIINKKILINK